MNMRDINLGAWRFVKTKGIHDEVDINEALRNWKELVKNAPNECPGSQYYVESDDEEDE